MPTAISCWRSAAWAVSAVAFAAPARRVLHYLIAGTLWGGLAYLLGYRAFGRPIWGGVLAGPFIGAIVGGLLQRPFERRSRLPRSLLALASLYLGATLFGLALAVTDWRALTAGTAHPLQAVGAEIVAVWWGITLTGFLLFLWPLAYGTHWLLEWYETR